MYYSGRTFKQIGSLLLLAMYVSFLCFQVNYNLCIGRNCIRWKQRDMAVQEDPIFLSTINPELNRSTVVAKPKPAPSKRFYQKTVYATAASDIHIPTVHFAHPVFGQQLVSPPVISFIRSNSLRGPPTAA